MFKAAQLLGERVAGSEGSATFTLDKVLPVAAGIGGGSADAAAALRLLAQANGLAIDDARLIEVARLTGADVPVCLASRACVMTGVGETLLPLSLPKMPCVLVNPRVPVATKDVFGRSACATANCWSAPADVMQATAWPEAGASVEDWVEVACRQLQRSRSAGDAHSARDRRGDLGAQRHQRGLAGADVGLGRDLLCDL